MATLFPTTRFLYTTYSVAKAFEKKIEVRSTSVNFLVFFKLHWQHKFTKEEQL